MTLYSPVRPHTHFCRRLRHSRIPTRREAHNLLSSLLRPTNLGLRKACSTMLFGDFAQKWEEAALPTYRASTHNFYRDILRRHLAPKFAQYRLCAICSPDLQIFLNKKAERYAPSVLHHIRATMSRICASAKQWGYVETNLLRVFGSRKGTLFSPR